MGETETPLEHRQRQFLNLFKRRTHDEATCALCQVPHIPILDYAE